MRTVILPEKFTIDRKIWLRGKGSQGSKLLCECDGKMCCLGFLCLAAGCLPNEISNISDPRQLMVDKNIEVNHLVSDNYNNSSFCLSLIEINDYPNMNDYEREERLTNIFQELGVEVEFIN